VEVEPAPERVAEAGFIDPFGRLRTGAWNDLGEPAGVGEAGDFGIFTERPCLATLGDCDDLVFIAVPISSFLPISSFPR
jgi:hypothetical protein